MIEDCLGFIVVFTLIGEFRLSSVMLFSIGIGLICALYEVNIKRKIAFEKKSWFLLKEQALYAFRLHVSGKWMIGR